MMYRICRFYEISLHEFADILDPRELERSDLSTLLFIPAGSINVVSTI